MTKEGWGVVDDDDEWKKGGFFFSWEGIND